MKRRLGPYSCAALLLVLLAMGGCGSTVEVLRREPGGIDICNTVWSLTPEEVDSFAAAHCHRYGKDAQWRGRKNNCGSTKTGMLSIYQCVDPRPLAESDRFPRQGAGR